MTVVQTARRNGNDGLDASYFSTVKELTVPERLATSRTDLAGRNVLRKLPMMMKTGNF